MSETPLLGLPVLEANQAQKHVTHNEALLILDAAIHLSVGSRSMAAPPGGAVDGDRYLVAASPTGAWAGQASKLAVLQAGAWVFSAPRTGWRLWVVDETKFFLFDGTAWRDLQAIAELENTALLGVNATADSGNRLSVSSPAVLFTHAGNDQRVKLNKQSAFDTASLLYQTGFSGRAEMGLAGDDDFHVKVSSDGSSWHEAIVVDRTTGAVALPNTTSTLPSGDKGDVLVSPSAWHFTRTNGSPGDGVNDDAPYWNTMLAAGKTVVLSDRKNYLLKSPVLITVDGTGVMAPMGASVNLSMATGAFDNTAYADRYSISNSGHKYAVSFYANSSSGVFVKGLKISPSAWTEYRYLSAIYFKTCTDPEISGNEISGFSRGLYVAGNDWVRGKIRQNYIHDCYSKSATMADGTTPLDASTGQMTGIVLDADCSVGSQDFEISGNVIRNITQSASIIALIQQQTDGINGQGVPSKPTRGGRIFGNHIYNVGDGIDMFGQENLIFGNKLERCFNQAVKLMHGSSRNQVYGNEMIESGMCGVRFGSSNSTAVNADNNDVHDNLIYKVNSAIDWKESDGTNFYTTSAGSTYWTNTYNGGAGTPTAGVRVDVINGASSHASNEQIVNNTIDLNSTGDYGIYIENVAGGAGGHVARGNTILNPKTAEVQDGKSYIEFREGKLSRLEAQATYTLTNSTAAQNVFDSGGKYRFNAKAGRRYRVCALIQVTGLSASPNSLSALLTGTATFTQVSLFAVGKKGGGAGTSQATANFTSGAAQTVTPSDTQTTGQYMIEGIICVNASGTIIPQLQMNSNAAAAVLSAGSFFEFTEDINTAAATGDWS